MTFNPYGLAVVLVDFGDLTLSEPAFTQAHATQAQPYLRSEWVDIWDRGAVQFTAEISVVKEYATEAEAREGQLAHALEVAGWRHQALKVEIEGGTRVFEFATAAISSATPQMMRELGGGVRVAWVYSLALSQLAEEGAS